MAIPSTDLAPTPRLAPFDSLHRYIDQTFSDLTRGLGFTPLSLDSARFAYHPSADLHDNGEVTTIRVELPGVDIADVNVEVSDGSIEISGEKKSETETKDGDRYRSERIFGSFYRAFAVPFAIDPDQVEASFDKGVLTVKFPTAGGAQPPARKIAIKS